MKTASQAVIDLLATNSFVIAELYTLTLVGGGILRYTGADIDIAWSGNSWTSKGPRIQRDKVHMKVGLDVDTLQLTIAPQATDLIGSAPWLSAARGGMLDGAVVELDFALLPGWQSPVTGTVVWFLGRVAEVDAGRTLATLKVNSHLELLTAPFPRNIYGAGCRHTLYDAGCTLNPANFSATFSVSLPSGVANVINAGLLGTFSTGTPTFVLGRILWTSGANAGSSQSVVAFQASPGNLTAPYRFTLMRPPPFAAAVGDQFTAYYGCDKQITTCSNIFNNLGNFGGTPFIPVPETAV